MKSRKFLAVVLCLSLISSPILAQSPRPAPKAKTAEEQKLEQQQKELEQKALAMLEELLTDAQTLRLPENRARVLAAAGDMLWRHDEKRARSLFGDAMKTLAQVIHLPEDSPEALPENVRWQVYNLRQELVQMIARNDAQLALDFLAATRQPANGQQAASNDDQESQLELLLAQQVVQQDPKRALALAKEKLETAKNPGVVGNLLYSLREKDFAAAQELTEIVLGKLRGVSVLDQESATFAINLLHHAPHPDNNPEALSGQQKYLISHVVARELIEKVLAATQAEFAKLKNQSDPNLRYPALNLINNLKSFMSHIEKYAPASLPALKRILPEADKMKDVHQKRWDDLNELAQKGSPDLLIQAAAKAAPEMQNNYFQRAAQLAREKGDVERARQIIKEGISDSNQQRQALREIDQQVMWQRINENKYDEARQLMAGMRYDWERINVLTQMAMNAQNGGKKEIAAQFMEEALTMIDGQAESSQILNSRFLIAGVFVQINPARSFEVIESMLDQFNELLGAAAVVESFQQQGSFRQKEMVLNSGGLASQYLPQYGQQLAALVRTDLPRVQTIINRFTRSEARIAVRMFVLQQFLRSNNGTVGLGASHRYRSMEIH